MTGTPPPGFRWLPGHLDRTGQEALLAAVAAVASEAPFYIPTMPRSGRPMSVAMTNCGTLGWVSDKSGYRYQPHHPETGRLWPPMPDPVREIWAELADTASEPEACLVNWYRAGAKLGLHRDEDECDMSAPVISVSLGDDCRFRIGGLRRSDPTESMRLGSGDVVILGGGARLAYHGVDRIYPGSSALLERYHDLFTGGGRINLTLRRVGSDQD